MNDDWYRPDDPGWHQDLNYSPTVAIALRCAHERVTLNPGDARAYAEALQCLEPSSSASMSTRQRLAVLFIVSLAQASSDLPMPALEPIDEALELALALDIEPAQLDLLLLRASVNRYVLQMPDAVEDLRTCLDLFSIHTEHRDLSPTELATRLDVVLHLTFAEFYMGHFESADQLLQRATSLIPQVPADRLAPFTQAWARALLLRWQGQYELALTQAMTAAEGYSAYGDGGMTSRIEGVAADIALDLAERAQHNGEEFAAEAFLAVAERYVQSAIEVAAAADYESSQTMAFVIYARLRQLRREPDDRIEWLKELADLGRQHSDMAVVAHVCTQLGREHEAVGAADAAKEWYNQALAVLRESYMSALGVWAQRGLWRLQGEMSPDDRP